MLSPRQYHLRIAKCRQLAYDNYSITESYDNERNSSWKSNANLIDRLPENLEQYECKHIEQGYLNTDPVVRIRKSNDKYTLTYKGAGLMCREEYNLPLNAEAFAHLKEKIDGILIQKRRYLIPLTDKLTIELDVFEGELAPLQLAEVEFETKEEAEHFVPPAWFGEDVTFSSKYHNSTLSKH